MNLNINLMLGLACIVLGILSISAGIGGGIMTMIRTPKAYGIEESNNIFTEFINALGTLTQALTAAPTWIAMNIIGLILIFFGFNIINTSAFIC